MKIFIGSSRESKEYITKISSWIEEDGHQPIPWNEHTAFPPGHYVFPRLIEISKEVDAAVFVFAEDDKVWYRQDNHMQPRDNVLLEYGLFSGVLGQFATIICTIGNPKIPTDAQGIVAVDISPQKQYRAKEHFKSWLKALDNQRKSTLAKTNQKGEDDVRVFKAPTDVKYNYPFYEYFEKVIRSAKQDIYITGEGFECTDGEGIALARSFTDAIKDALKTVCVVRIQTKLQSNSKWAEMLAELLEEYPENFKLYVLKKEKISQLSSVCVIDPEHAGSNIVEIMLSTHKSFGTTTVDLAGTGVFIEGQQILALDLRSRILALKDPQVSRRLIDPDEVKSSLCEEEYYFAYGSNMVKQQMKSRCSSAIKVGVGILKDYKIVFNRKGSYRAGGVASIEKADGNRVYGVIWKIHSSEFWELDQTEDPKAYVRKQMIISGMAGESFPCHIYEAIPEASFVKPDADYLKLMISGAKEAGLPDNYVSHLESFDS